MAKDVGSKTFTLAIDQTGAYDTRPPGDTTAPTVPQNVRTTSTGQTSWTIAWNASTDPQSGVAYYTVTLSTGATDTTTGTSYTFTGLTASTPYSATVTSTDNADNTSGVSQPATTVTSSAPPNPTDNAVVTPLHYDDFNGTVIDSSKTDLTKRWSIADDYDSNFDTAPTLSTNRFRSGSKSCRVQLTYTKNSGTQFTVNGGKVNESGHRNELNGNRPWSVTGWNGVATMGNEYWYGCSIYLPDSGDAFGDPEWESTPYPSYEILMQWHDSPDTYTGTAVSVPSSTTVVLPNSANSTNGYYAGNITIGGQTRTISGYVGSTRTITVSAAFSPTPAAGTFLIQERNRNPMLVLSVDRAPGGAGTNRTNWNLRTASQSARFGGLSYDTNVSFDLGSYAADKGTWTDWVYRCLWQYQSGSGILQVWKDGVLVVSRINLPNCYNDWRAPYAIPIGFYTQPFNPQTQTPPAVAPTIVEQRAAYYDNWIMAQVTGNPTNAAVDTSNSAYQKIAAFVSNGTLPT